MTLLNVDSHVSINAFYLVSFCIHVYVDVIKKNKNKCESEVNHRFYLVREVGKMWRYSCWEKSKFIMVNKFKYVQHWKTWPSPLSLLQYL